MKPLTQIHKAIVVLTMLATSTIGFAHDGHHPGNSAQSYVSDDNTRGYDRYRTAPDTGRSCGTGGCCSAAGGCSLNSQLSTGPLLTRTTATTEGRLEQLSMNVLSAVRGELRNSRNYSDLVADAGDVVRSASRLRDARGRGASQAVLLEEARLMLAPLKRMNAALKQEVRSTESLAAVQEAGRLLVSYGRDLQTAVTSRDRGDLSPPRVMDSTGRDRGSVSIPAEMKGVALLPVSEQAAALRQRTCPVTQAPLGSMGRPTRVTVSGRSVYVCCDSCIDALRRNPDRYLSARSTQPRDLSRSIGPSYPEPPATLNSNRNGLRIPEEMKGVRLLPTSEQAAALHQRTCPVNGEPLGSMGKPIRVDVAGRSVYVCCAGCVNAVKRNPQKYLR